MLNKIGIRFGLIGFAIYALYVIISWQFNLSLLVNPLISLLLSAIIIFLSIYSQLQARKLNSGFLDYTYTLQVYMITALISIMGYYLTAAIIFNLIDPGAVKEVVRLSAKQTIALMDGMFGMMGQEQQLENMDEEILEQAMQNVPNPFGLTLILSLVGSIFMYTVIGLITAAIIRKDEPMTFQ